ncbi:MAG: hypothetical protein QHH09_01285 [Microgenomates group bacterium]|nr:hypothetical protein [Microgenomates group bacterium]
MKKSFIFLIIAFSSLTFLYFTNKNKSGYWSCENNRWKKHGNPKHPQPKVSCPKKISLPKTKEDCQKQGGVWKKWGLSPVESCNLKTNDDGNPCQDSSECEGICKVNLTKEELRKKTFNKNLGQCSEWLLNFGCFGKMEKGKVRVVCVD